MGIFKKSLGIVLAGATLMTAGALSVSADAPKYDDGDSIYYNEAVDVLATIGVMNGRDPTYEGGKKNFDPNGTLTRAEGCRIIVQLLNMEGVTGVGSFSDVAPNFWAASEIAYCQREGIVNGYPDGRFGPDDQLTGSQFAKMLLVAAGYDAEIEGMSGPQWEISVAKLVRSTDLDESLVVSGDDENLKYDPVKPISRQQAAQMAFNLLMTPIVEYENKGTSLSVNGAELNFGASNAKPVSRNRNSYTSNVFTDTVNTGDTIQGEVVEFAEDHWKDLVLEDTTSDKLSKDRGFKADEFGRPSRKWMYKNAEIGSYVAKVNLLKVFNDKVTLKDLYDLLGKSTYDSLINGTTKLIATVDGNKYNLSERSAQSAGANGQLGPSGIAGVAGTVTTLNAVIVDNEYRVSDNFKSLGAAAYSAPAYKIQEYVDSTNINGHFVNRTDTGAVNDTDNGSVTEVYLDNNTNKVYVCTYNSYVYQAVNDYNSAKGSVNLSAAGNTEEYEMTHLYNGKSFTSVAEADIPDSAEQIKSLKTDDYALLTLVDKSEYVCVVNATNGAHNGIYITDTNTPEFEIKSVTKAEVKSGKVTSYNSEGNERVTLDGTDYKYSKTAMKDADTVYDDGVKSTGYTIGDTAKIVLDQFGYIIAVDDARSTSDYVFIRTFGNNSNFVNTPVADAYFADGTTATIYVKEAYDYSNTLRDDYVSAKATLANDFYVNDGNWYTFTKNSANEYTLNPIEKKYDVYGTRSQPANTADTKYQGYGYEANYRYFYADNSAYRLSDIMRLTNVTDNSNPYFMYNRYAGGYVQITNNDKTQFLRDNDFAINLYMLADGTQANSANNRLIPISTRTIGNFVYSTESRAAAALRADSDTIFIVNDSVKDKVNRYLGYKNAPEIRLFDSYADVFVVADGSYAKMVYIDINSYEGTYGNNADTSVSGSTSQIAYLIKYDGKTTSQNADTVYSYVALNPTTGEEYTIKTDEAVTELGNGKDGFYDAYIVRDSGKAGLSTLDRINSNTATYADGGLSVRDSDTFVETGLVSPISFSGGVLTMIDGSAYTIASDAKITLITLGRNTDAYNNVYSDARTMNSNTSNDYEVQLNLTGKQLENALKPYYYIYGVSGRMNGSSAADDREIKELYVTVQFAYDSSNFDSTVWDSVYNDTNYGYLVDTYLFRSDASGNRYNEKYSNDFGRFLFAVVNGYVNSSTTSMDSYIYSLYRGTAYV